MHYRCKSIRQKKGMKRQENDYSKNDQDDSFPPMIPGKTKRRDQISFRRVKITPKDEKIFQISYSNPRLEYFSCKNNFAAANLKFSSLEEECSLPLLSYKKTYTFKVLSYIQQGDLITKIYKEYDVIHTELKGPSHSKHHEKKAKIPQMELLNSKLEMGLSGVEAGVKIETISKLLGIKKSQLYLVLKKKKNNQEPVIQTQRRPSKIKQEYLDFINSFLQVPKNCFTSLYCLRNLLTHKFKLEKDEISIQLVHKMIIKTNFSWKRCKKNAIFRNVEKSIENRYNLMDTLLKHRLLKRKFIYLDETGFNNTLIPIHGYCKKNQSLLYSGPPKCPNISVLAAMTDDGLMGYQIFEKSVTARDFAAFIIKLIIDLELQEKGLDNYVFFCDNAKIHVAKVFSELRNYLHFCYNAAYSPFLNPIEELFALWKHNFRSINTKGEKEVVIQNIIKASQNITKRQCIGFVKHSISFYQDCLDRKSII